jgi:hypothetical protein
MKNVSLISWFDYAEIQKQLVEFLFSLNSNNVGQNYIQSLFVKILWNFLVLKVHSSHKNMC